MANNLTEWIIVQKSYKGPFNNYVTLRLGGGLGDALRAVVNTALKSVTKGGGGIKNLSKKRYVIVEQPLMGVIHYKPRIDL